MQACVSVAPLKTEPLTYNHTALPGGMSTGSPTPSIIMSPGTPLDMRNSPYFSIKQGLNGNNATSNFVHKLHGMVVDKMYQHLISWNYSGTSFIVCNVLEFSRDVLPKPLFANLTCMDSTK